MSQVLTLLLVSFSLGLSNFAASVAIGISGIQRSIRTRVALVFGFCEIGMPFLGLLVGEKASSWFGGYTNMVGGLLLIIAGFYTLYEALRWTDESEVKLASHGWSKLLIAGVALSIDNLIVGFSLGAHRINVVFAVMTIGIISISLSLIGLEVGRYLNRVAEEYADILSGLVLAGVGLAICFGLL